jgi:hypothetical protein
LKFEVNPVRNEKKSRKTQRWGSYSCNSQARVLNLRTYDLSNKKEHILEFEVDTLKIKKL